MTEPSLHTSNHHHLRPAARGALEVVNNALAEHAETGRVTTAKYGFSETPKEGLAAATTALRIRSIIESRPNSSLQATDALYTGKDHYWLSARSGADVDEVMAEIVELMTELHQHSVYFIRFNPGARMLPEEQCKKLISVPSVILMISVNGVKLKVENTTMYSDLRRAYDQELRRSGRSA